MAKRGKNALVGIELGIAEVRIVETRWTGPKPVVLAAGSAPLPKGAIMNGVVIQTTQVANTIRLLLDSKSIASRSAVIGIPSQACISRSFTMPPVPAEELAVLVEGEVQHYQVLKSAGGAYGYFSTGDPKLPAAENTVVVAGAEEDATSSLREVATKAGLELVGLEPVWLAAYRGSHWASADPDTTVWLGVLENSTELVISRLGIPYLYRHVDVGCQHLFVNSNDFVDEETKKSLISTTLPDGMEVNMRRGPADTVSLELRRILNFAEREFPGPNAPSRLRLASNIPEVAALATYLSESLPMPAEVVHPDGLATTDGTVLAAVGGISGARFVPALGLSIYRSEHLTSALPSMDLSTVERAAAEKQFETRQLASSLVAAILIVVFSIIAGLYIGIRANRVAHALEHDKEHLEALKKTAKKMMAAELSQAAQIEAVKSNSIDLIPIMDVLSNSLNSDSGLNRITITKLNGVAISGESKSEPSMLQVVDSLQTYPFLTKISIVSYELIDSERRDSAIRFNMNIVPQGYGTAGSTP